MARNCGHRAGFNMGGNLRQLEGACGVVSMLAVCYSSFYPQGLAKQVHRLLIKPMTSELKFLDLINLEAVETLLRISQIHLKFTHLFSHLHTWLKLQYSKEKKCSHQTTPKCFLQNTWQQLNVDAGGGLNGREKINPWLIWLKLPQIALGSTESSWNFFWSWFFFFF